MRKLILFLMCLSLSASMFSQRMMEKLDRGTVAVKTSTGVFVSWRILGEEYYDTQYNLYRDGTKVNSVPLNVSNYSDAMGTVNSTYSVAAVVRGTEQTKSTAVSVMRNQYLSIPMGRVYSRRGVDITSKYILNDVSAADLDGDGQYELIVKRINSDDGDFTEANDSAYCKFEAYKMDGTKLWTIDCGPNLISGGHVETNIVAFDWDQDGKAELVMRAADGTILGDGTVCGDITKNYRNKISHSANMTYATTGDEFLVYMEGATGKPYFTPIAYPLKRFESGETDLEAAWGDGYGHRSNKFFFGAPYLDGVHPSLFLARGIYTRHKMIAYDINPTTHQLTTRWTWTNNQGGSPWYGEGYHNYGIADVDWDGRDEICYGSMVIDDNGKGLSTTGYGHGDAQHCSDLDPYRWGQEIFACNEDAQGANYRDATTSKVYHWYSLGRDCGRAMAGNFTDEYPGSQCVAVGMGLLSTTTDKVLTSNTTGITQDYRIYWDGDLCEESLDGVGTEGNAAVYKFGQSDPIFTATGTKLCNWTKNTPSLQADILGDWREEIVARSEDNMSLRIYTTVDPTPWRNYTLLHDMQYRQAVCWQMCGYNQPPHVSYFLGKTEGFTVAPPPVMTNGRTVETTAITAADNNKHVMLCDPNGGNVTVADGASPYILTVNAFSHTQGSAPSECTTKNTAISTTYSTYTLTGGAFTGAMRLVKQGEGILSMSGNQTYTGETDLWGGTLKFDGTLPNSSVVMKRFSKLASTATFGKGISMEYGAEIIPGGADTKGTLTVDSLSMNFGAIIDFDIYSDGLASDMVKVNKKLTLGESTLTNGPAYSTPVFRFKQHNATGATMPAEGKYLIMSAAEVSGNLDNVTLEGLSGVKCYLQNESGNVYLVVEGLRSASDVTWVGNVDGTWNLADVMNFTDKKGESDFFVTGDNVTIDDNANTTAINVTSEIVPGSITVNNDEKSFSIGGDGEIGGTGSITKNGSAALTLSGTNSYTGGTIVNGGTLKVATLPNAQSQYSSIGSYQAGKTILQLNGGSTLMPTAAVNMGSNIHLGSAAGDGGTISTSYGFTMTGAFLGYNLTKNGSGTLTMSGSNSIKKTILSGGTIEMASDANGLLGDTVVFNSGTLRMCDSYGSYSTASWNLSVPKGKTGTLYGDSRCALTGALVGEGTLNVYAIASSSTPRCHFMGNWSKFAGTLNARSVSNCDFQLANGYGMPNATLNTVSGMNIVAQQENGSKTQTYSFAVGEVTGNGTLSTCNRWTIGDDGDFTFAGNIANAPFTKVGTGKMTITGVTVPTSVIVSAGTLCLNNSSATTGMLGTGALTVNKDAKLSGAGMLSNSLTTVNGTLQPGLSDYSLSGAIDFGGSNVVLNDGSTFASCINSKLFYLRLTNIGTMTIKSGATIKVVVRSSFAPSVGDEYQIWSATTNNVDVSTLKLDLPSFGDWLVWDTSDLASGKLRIAGTDGLNSILAGGDVKCTVFRENGALVGTFNTAYDQIRNHLSGLPISHGVYIVQLKKDNRSWCLKMTK